MNKFEFLFFAFIFFLSFIFLIQLNFPIHVTHVRKSLTPKCRINVLIYLFINKPSLFCTRTNATWSAGRIFQTNLNDGSNERVKSRFMRHCRAISTRKLGTDNRSRSGVFEFEGARSYVRSTQLRNRRGVWLRNLRNYRGKFRRRRKRRRRRRRRRSGAGEYFAIARPADCSGASCPKMHSALGTIPGG